MISSSIGFFIQDISLTKKRNCYFWKFEIQEEFLNSNINTTTTLYFLKN